jgi:hypothetical protein
MGERKNEPNNLGGILIGISRGKKYPTGTKPTKADSTAISKLRAALKQLTGISSDPFYTFNVDDGWKLRFKLIDDRQNADQRAKNRAKHVKYDENRDQKKENSSEFETDDAGEFETDDASEWQRNNS